MDCSANKQKLIINRDMDYQTTYNEAMAKFEETKKCQNEIEGYVKELKDIKDAISEISTIYNVNKTRQYLYSKQIALNAQINNSLIERNRKLSEALSKAFDLVDYETDNSMFNPFSFGAQAMEAISTFVRLNNICWQCSADVVAKGAKLINKGMNSFIQFLNQHQMYGGPWQNVFGNGNNNPYSNFVGGSQYSR